MLFPFLQYLNTGKPQVAVPYLSNKHPPDISATLLILLSKHRGLYSKQLRSKRVLSTRLKPDAALKLNADRKGNSGINILNELLSNFFVKKMTLSHRKWTGWVVTQWLSQWFIHVCISHQSDWSFYQYNKIKIMNQSNCRL